MWHEEGGGLSPSPHSCLLVVGVVERELTDIEQLLAIDAVQNFRMSENFLYLMVKVAVLRDNELYVAHLDSLTSSEPDKMNLSWIGR